MDERVGEYVAKLTASLRAAPGVLQPPVSDPAALSHQMFSILTSREFCYLGRTKTEPYREGAVLAMATDVRAGAGVRFYYDIGAGYHASIDPENSGLVFAVGFSELCVLAQIASLCNRVAEIYSPGARFVLVIDNVCGLVTNDIPLAKTAEYCAGLRALIDETGMNDRVGVLVESEEFALSEYAIDRQRLESDVAAMQPSLMDIENVSRFLGRPCDASEAAERMAKYRQAGELTERQLERVVRGVRMTQRATGGTLGFRPFPGGDSRTQVGELAISPAAKGGFRPVLLTSRNASRFRRTRLSFPGVLPSMVPYVTFADPLVTSDQDEK